MFTKVVAIVGGVLLLATVVVIGFTVLRKPAPLPAPIAALPTIAPTVYVPPSTPTPDALDTADPNPFAESSDNPFADTSYQNPFDSQ